MQRVKQREEHSAFISKTNAQRHRFGGQEISTAAYSISLFKRDGDTRQMFLLSRIPKNNLPLSKQRVLLKILEPITDLDFLLIFLAYLSSVGATELLVQQRTFFVTFQMA